MLFVALLSVKPGGTFQEGAARRLQWSYPEGMNVLREMVIKDPPSVGSLPVIRGRWSSSWCRR